MRDSLIGNGGVGTISYEIVPNDYDQSRANSNNQTWLASDVFFTRYKDCKSKRRVMQPQMAAPAMSQFVNNEAINSQDVVVWYKQSVTIYPAAKTATVLPRNGAVSNYCHAIGMLAIHFGQVNYATHSTFKSQPVNGLVTVGLFTPNASS